MSPLKPLFEMARCGRPAALLFLFGLMLWYPAAAHAQIEVEAEALYVGEPVEVTLPSGVDSLMVTYRPSSSISRTEIIPVGGAPVVEWTPAQPGVVRLAAEDGSAVNVSVRFQQIPAAGVVVLLLAGTILFGGAITASVLLFRGRPEDRNIF